MISVFGIGHFLGAAIGSAAACAAEALRRGGGWIIDKAGDQAATKTGG